VIKVEVPKKFMEDMKWGLDNYINLQLKFRDLWVAIIKNLIENFTIHFNIKSGVAYLEK
jgi:hypothetical protein